MENVATVMFEYVIIEIARNVFYQMCLILRGTDTIDFGNSEAVQLHTHLCWSICFWKGEKWSLTSLNRIAFAGPEI